MINYYDFVANIVLVYTYTYTRVWHTHIYLGNET